MQKKQYLCKRITKKKRLLFYALAGGEQSEENESVLCLSKRPRKGKTLLFFECKGTAFI